MEDACLMMGWLEASQTRKAAVVLCEDELKDEYFAVIRITWFSSGKAHRVDEQVYT